MDGDGACVGVFGDDNDRSARTGSQFHVATQSMARKVAAIMTDG
jgi:hypothetical protein